MGITSTHAHVIAHVIAVPLLVSIRRAVFLPHCPPLGGTFIMRQARHIKAKSPPDTRDGANRPAQLLSDLMNRVPFVEEAD